MQCLTNCPCLLLSSEVTEHKRRMLMDYSFICHVYVNKRFNFSGLSDVQQHEGAIGRINLRLNLIPTSRKRLPLQKLLPSEGAIGFYLNGAELSLNSVNLH